MSDFRKRLSGAEYRKRAKAKATKENELRAKVPKLQAYFHSASSTSISGDNVKNVSAMSCHEVNDEVNDVCANAVTDESASCDHVSTCVIEHEVESENSDNMNISTTDAYIIPEILHVSDDPADWIIDDKTVDYLLQHGIKQNMDADFSSTRRLQGDVNRYLSKSLFQRTLVNGETQIRTWLIFSKKKAAVYCSSCRLFKKSSILATEGFSDWANGNRRMKAHENSEEHRCAIATLIERKNVAGRIDRALIDQAEQEMQYWRNVLKRVAAIVRSLGSRGLPFRAKEERFGSNSGGNYLMCLELLAEFDPFLAEHIKRYGNKGSGTTSYLSSQVCEEFIEVMAESVVEVIIAEVKAAKYFSIIVDSTPDCAHVDQLAFIIRYVSKDNKEGQLAERFLKFVPNPGHKAADLVDTVLDVLKSYGIDIANCRGQSYDNAANMSGIYSGLQARIQVVNPLAVYIPCSAHSLNLVGSCAVECCRSAIAFFGVLQELYNFFTASTHRWEVLLSHQKSMCTTVKSLSQTRWSARHDACKSLCESWDEILSSLQYIADDNSEKATTRAEASGLIQSLDCLETCIMALFWHDILQRFNITSKTLQSVNVELGTIVELYQSLIVYVEGMRDLFAVYESKAMEKCGENEYSNISQNKRKRKRKIQFDEVLNNDAEFSAQDEFRVTVFNVIIDRLSTELRRRSAAYVEINKKFSFLTELSSLDPKVILEKASYLQTCYSEDLDDSFSSECIHLRSQLQSLGVTKTSVLELYQKLSASGLLDAIYPSVCIALRILLCTPATNCSAERAFSALKRVKNYVRSRMEQDRLNALAILDIESVLLQRLDYDAIIDKFARKKCRRKQF